jgi:mRNA-degrading endonuclease RelE of RelBE toxin-antitoxin system
MSKHDFDDAQRTIAFILLWKLENLDVKKLKGKDGIYRVRRGDYRITFTKRSDGLVIILYIDRRDEDTYK